MRSAAPGDRPAPPVPRRIHFYGPWTTPPPPRQRGGTGKTRTVDDLALNPHVGDGDELVTTNEPQGPVPVPLLGCDRAKIPIPGGQRLQSELNRI